ncbi:MAG: alpha-hydroxy-acid oxidizing protein [Gammaproteobacteria bacterium]|nr:alpha-hydroxy-acid oxidizing protein [Gammaproteobacteria bacterium]
MIEKSNLASRRAFLSFLASSPALLGARNAFAQLLHDAYAPEAVARASDAINVFDFHEVAKQVMSAGHYTYMALGTDSGGTLRANRAGFEKFQLRMRRLVDVQNVDTSIELFGERYPLPIMIAPVGHQKAFHQEGEPAVARAARSRNVEQILSTVTSVAVEEVNEARGRPVWFQLYTITEWQDTLAMVKRAEAAGCPVLAVTVDLPVSNREILMRHRRDTNAECQACHAPDAGVIPPKPMTGGARTNTRFVDWDYVDRLRDATSMRIVLKGIVAAEDAHLAVERGVDGIIVSNHGGRAEDSGRGTIESLSEVVEAVDGRMPVIVDGGFRRGTDVFKALALGADAVAIGRPYIWGLASFGQEGVETVLDILKRELEIVMMQARTTRIEEINRDFIV